jgi:hypothetical protein
MKSAFLVLSVLIAAASAAPAADAPRRPHPLAPSLPDLTAEQEAVFDKIVDDFILYDVGALRGEEGKKALEAFKKLPAESVFALIRGINKAAAFDDSCPAVVIGKKLSTILRGTTDKALLEFARENIGAGVKQSRHMGVIKDLRLGCALRKGEVDRLLALNPRLVPKTPSPGEQRQLMLIKPIASLDQTTLGKMRKMSLAELIQEADLNRGSKLRPILIEIEKRDGDKVLLTLAGAAISYEDDIRELGGQLLTSYLARQDAEFLKKKLEDDRKQIRLAAVKAVSKKGLRLGGELIDRLADEEPDVRQAARAALAKLNKGVDFGPGPDANKSERDAAVAKWREWWEKEGK